MGYDPQRSGRLVIELHIAEIGALQLDGCIEHLIQNGRQVWRRGRPHTQHIQHGRGRKLNAHARKRLAITGDRSWPPLMIVAHRRPGICKRKLRLKT